MTNTPARTSWILAITLVTLTTVGCKHQVRVAAVLPLSGEHQAYGEASRQGLDLALAELTAAGNTRFELTVVDSGSDPVRARQLLSQLYKDDAVVAIGGLTVPEAREMAPVAEDFKRVLLSPSATLRDQDDEARYFYSLSPSELGSGTAMATFAKRELGIRNAVVVTEKEISGGGLEKGFLSAFENQGGKVLALIRTPANSDEGAGTSAEKTVAKALLRKSDAIYLAGYEHTVSSLIHELRQRRYPGKILTSQALAGPSSLKRLGADAHGVLLTHTAFEVKDGQDHVRGFVARFQERFGEEPGIFAAESYDALMVLATALADRPALPSEVQKGLLHGIKDYRGVTGSLQFNEARTVPKIPRIYSVAKDLSLRDHGRYLQAERERIAAEKRELVRRLENLRGAAAQASSG